MLAGDNSFGQLGQKRQQVAFSHNFLELPASFGLCARSIALGQDHSLVLTYGGELHAFGRNTEGQCGLQGLNGKLCIEEPVRVSLPSMPDVQSALAVWAVAAGPHHNVVFCSGETRARTDSDAKAKDTWSPDSPLPRTP